MADMTAPPAGALEACPFCGNADDIEMQQAQADHYVQCLECEASTSCVGSRREAAELWNRRTHGPALLAALRLREGCEGLVDSLPSNWCDPMLTGPDAALGSGPWGCPDVERLIAAIKQRLRDDLARVLEESATGDEAG